MYNMVLVRFSIYDSLESISFFERIFLLAETSIEMVLEMSFLTFSISDVNFHAKKLI